MESNKEIKETIFSFFKNKITRNAQLHFQHWLLKKENTNEKEIAMRHLWEEIDVLSDESIYKDLKEIHGRIKYLNRSSKPVYISILRAVGIFLLPILAFTVTYFYFENYAGNIEMVQCYVPKGETKHLLLSDGTEVWVNSDSYISYPKKFAYGNRTVNLTGEAYFQVAKSPLKPFVVNTNRMNVRVLGTKFNLSAYPDLSEVKTTLKEGRVKVSVNYNKKVDTYTLSPNEELSLNVKTGDIAKRIIETSDLSTWNEGNVLFNAALMSDIFKQMDKKFGIRIVCNTEKYEDKRLTVKFKNNENINEVLEILRLIVPELKINKKDSIVYVE